MVLAQLGEGITAALSRMCRATVADDAALTTCLNDVSHALLRADVRFEAVRAAIHNVKSTTNPSTLPPGVDRRRAVHKAIFAELCHMLDPGKPPFTPTKGKGNKPNVVVFVGLQGSGKTTTCAKYAAYHRRKGFAPALVCADTFRAGAFDQLKQNASKAKIPFYGSYTESDPVKIAMDGVDTFRKEKCDLIIVDTSGRHRQEDALFEEMRQLSEATKPDLVIFVVDASIGQAAFDQALAFKKSAPVGAVIVTKMDGHAKGGGALSAVAATRSPVIFIGTGEHIPDLEPFDVKPFVSRLMGMGDLRGLVDKFNDVVPDDDDNDELVPDLTGDFTLKTMRQMLKSVQRVGPLGQVLSMIPGLSAQFMEKGKEKEGQAKMKRYMTIMASMTRKELEFTNPSTLMTESRIVRVARGSGRPVRDVAEMLEEHKRIAKALSKLPLKKLANNNNSRETLKVLGNVLPPGMMNQLGGMHGLQSMMKQMGAGKMMS
nr:unnamed protein product [Digitaria exilis]